MSNENEKTNGIIRQSRNSNFSKQAQRVFLYCKNDAQRSELIDDILSHDAGMDCVVSYAEGCEENVLKDELSETGLFAMWVTEELLDSIRNSGLPTPYQMAKELGVPVLPIAEHNGLFTAFTELAGAIHGIAKSENEYRNNLKRQLESFLVSDEIIKRIDEKAFDGNIFLSYRKMDYKYARQFMKIFHDEFPSVPVWYDNFLTAGRVFDEEIREAMEKADIFTLLVTPNLMLKNDEGKDNYVMAVEYPFAVSQNKPIISVEAQATNKDELGKFFNNQTTIDINNIDALKQAFFGKLQTGTFDCARLYLLGVAYLKGYKVERDGERAVKLLEAAVKYECEQALKAMELLAKSYTDGTLEMNYQKALPWREKIVTLCEKIHGVESIHTAKVYDELGDCYHLLSDHQEALVFFDKARIVHESLHGAVHEEISRIYSNMGKIYAGQADFTNSLDCLIKARNISEKLGVTDSILFAEILANIGFAYIDMHDYTKTLEYAKKSLDILKKKVGAEHEKTLFPMHVIAQCYRELNDIPKAIGYYIDALTICKKVYGEQHLTSDVYFGLGACYHRLGELPEALAVYTTSLYMREKVFGMENALTAQSYDAVGSIYTQMNDFTKALEYCNKGLTIREKLHGAEHPQAAYSYSSVGWLYYNMNDFPHAVEFHGKALAVREKMFGVENANTADSYNAIGWAYHNMNDFSRAVEFHGKALTAREKVFGAEHVNTIGSYEALGYVHHAAGEYIKALEYFNKTLAAREKVLGTEHPDTIKTTEFITNVLAPDVRRITQQG